MSSPYLIFLEVALVALALWLHSVLFSLVTFIVLSYFTPKYMYDKTIKGVKTSQKGVKLLI